MEHVSPENFSVTCRACLSMCAADMCSFSVQETLKTFASTVTLCLPERDSLPWQICSQCFVKCKEWNEFRTMCLENEKLLQSFVELIEEGDADAAVLDTSMHEEEVEVVEEISEEIAESEFKDSDELPDLPPTPENSEETYTFCELGDSSTTEVGSNLEVGCPLCARSAVWSYEFHEHLRDHIAMEQSDVLLCPKCGKDFVGEDSLLRHIYEYIDVVFSCPRCDTLFEYPMDLLDHQAKSSCYKLPEVRSSGSSRSQAYRKRPRAKHDDDVMVVEEEEGKQFECDICGRRMKDKPNLDRHRKRHTAERQFKCPLCSQTFVFANELATHVQYHDPANHKYVCKLCDPPKRYFFKRSLDAHCKRNHKARERDKVCNVCDKRFYDETALKKHAIIHTGEKNHECEQCLQRFIRADHLKTHMKTHQRPNKQPRIFGNMNK